MVVGVRVSWLFGMLWWWVLGYHGCLGCCGGGCWGITVVSCWTHSHVIIMSYGYCVCDQAYTGIIALFDLSSICISCI